jgi:hypothetical protein
MPELAGRGQGRDQESNSDGNLFHWEHFFLFKLDMRLKGASYMLSKSCDVRLGG